MKTMILVLVIAGMTLGVPQGKGKGKGNSNKGRDSNSSVGVAVYSIPGPDVAIIREQYRGTSLPPGLAKKLARGGSLPPGWQKKIQPVPVIIEQRLAPLPYGYRRGIYEGAYVVYDSQRGVIFDLFMSF